MFTYIFNSTAKCKLLIVLTGCLILNINSLGQNKSKITMDLSLQGVKMLYDNSAPGNSNFFWLNKDLPMGIGAELSISYNTNSKFSPQLDLSFTGFNYRYYTFEYDTWKYNTLNIFIGSSYQVVKHFELSFTIGTSFIKYSRNFLGMKPELCYSIGNKERVKIKFSWTHILTKYGEEIEPFGYLGLGVGYRLF